VFGRGRRRWNRREPAVEFERFTERARKVVVVSQEEARGFNHNYIGTEHLLLGLIREEEGVAGRVLASLGVGLDQTREQVVGIVGYGEEALGGQIPFTPRSKKIMELALRESMQLDHDYIGTEHILLGLIRESEGVAARVLASLDVDPDRVRREVLNVVGSPAYSGLDPLALAETLLERPPKFPDTMLRVKVEGLEIQARYGSTEEERSRGRRLVVDVEYLYDEARLSGGAAATNPKVVLGGIAGTLGGQDFPSLSEVVKRIGNYVLDTFPEITETTVTVTDTYEENEELPISGVSVTKVFSRFFRV